jgi:hypothetical protein
MTKVKDLFGAAEAAPFQSVFQNEFLCILLIAKDGSLKAQAIQ